MSKRNFQIDESLLKKCNDHGHYTSESCPKCQQIQQTKIIEPIIEQVASQDRSKWWPRAEKELHELFKAELLRRGIEYVYCRTDKQSTIEVGWPDFTVLFCGTDGTTRSACIEFKNKVGKTSKDQERVIKRLRESGIPVLVTGDFSEAIDFLMEKIIK